MDRSMDSIGSCSLDVDADSTDFSDTSDSLNICTPQSGGKDITREFTSRIHERCQLKQIAPYQKSAVILDPSSGKVNTILSTNAEVPIVQTQTKKPSYLNLACCVNGYSNLTTYDSQLRQTINKSRAASPIRPLTRTALYTHITGGSSSSEDNFLVIPQPSYVINGIRNSATMDSEVLGSPEKRSYFMATKPMQNGNRDETDNTAASPYYKQTTNKALYSPSSQNARSDSEAKSPKSFIQQRVERLYGPSALAQGFYSPKRTSTETTNSSPIPDRSPNNHSAQSKLPKTIDYVNGSSDSNVNSMIDEQSLPVLRHLRPEFRAQLPILSPKRTVCKLPIAEQSNRSPTEMIIKPTIVTIAVDADVATAAVAATIVDDLNVISTVTSNVILMPPSGKPVTSSLSDININGIVLTQQQQQQQQQEQQQETQTNGTSNGISEETTVQSVSDMTLSETNGSGPPPVASVSVGCASVYAYANGGSASQKKDGNYFLNIINNERERLLSQAIQVEKDTETLLQNAENSDEEMIGNLRSASGKAKLLATQKMQQFEGLCHNSLNQKPGEKYPTTSEDLQGFWDMVLLQVDHVDSLFKEIDLYRTNNWKKPPDTEISPKLNNVIKTNSKRPLTAKSVYGNSHQQTKSMSSDRTTTTTNGTSTKQKSATAIAAAQRREQQRKQLLELKRKNKIANSDKQEPDIDICVDKISTS